MTNISMMALPNPAFATQHHVPEVRGFKKFPREVRDMIWELAVDDIESRVVEICFAGYVRKLPPR